jgi:flavorubredoxin
MRNPTIADGTLPSELEFSGGQNRGQTQYRRQGPDLHRGAQVTKKIKEVVALNVPVDMICPSHGVLWRQDPMQIVNRYLQWADTYAENQVTFIYDTMWESTRKMAETIAKGILAGSPTVNKGMLSSLAGLFEEVTGLRFKGKKAAAFGSYGWSGESVKLISEKLEQAGFTILNDGLREKWNPDTQAVENCFNFGKSIGEILKS